MSDLILPEHMAKARRKEKAKIAEKGKTAAEIEQKQKEVEDIYGERELATGPDAYADTNKFPEGPWCQKGDWVIFARYAGSRLKIDGGELRLLNDDEILAILQDPTDILHM